MSENLQMAQAFLRELNERRDAYVHKAAGEIATFFKRRERRPPEVFQNSSYLYIRSHIGDAGIRPLSNVVFWNSPDILISPVSSVGAYTTELQAGETYLIRCALRNRGDLAVPSAKVELFLVTPSLGFNTRFATNLTLGQVPTVWVPSNGSATADFVFTVPASEAGHKCLFARTFSFSPLERPVDVVALDPVVDRHIGQKNLNIIGQSQTYNFNLVHQPNAQMLLSIRAMAVEELLRLNHPVMAELKPLPEPPRGELIAKMGLEEIDGAEGITIERSRQGLLVQARRRGAPTLVQHRKIRASVRRLLTAIEAGKSSRREGRSVLQEFAKVNEGTRQTRFRITVPNFGLRRGQAIGLNVTAADQNLDPPLVIGGITLIVAQR